MLLEYTPALAAKRIVLASASPRRRELLQQLGLKFEVRLAISPHSAAFSAANKGGDSWMAAAALMLPALPTVCCPAASRLPALTPPRTTQVIVSSFEETLPKDQYSAAEYARHTATHKAVDVANQLLAQAQAQAAAAGGREAEDGSAGEAIPVPDLVIGADTVVEYGEHILEKPVDAEDAARVLRMLSGQRHHVHTGVALVLPATRNAAAAATPLGVLLFSVCRPVRKRSCAAAFQGRHRPQK